MTSEKLPPKTSKKLPPEKVEELARQLQSKLKKGRPRSWLTVLIALAASVLLLGGLAWWLYPRPEPPRLEVVAFDSAFAGEESPTVAAQLALPEGWEAFALSDLNGREIVFTEPPFAAVEVPQLRKVATDMHGRASTAWRKPAQRDGVFEVRYIDVERRRGSADQGKLFRLEPSKPVLLVDVEETLAELPGDGWGTTHPGSIKQRPGAAEVLRQRSQDYEIVYLALQPDLPMAYRRVRGWVQGQLAGRDALPPGPVLGRKSYPGGEAFEEIRPAMYQGLRARFPGAMVAVVGTAASADAARAQGLRVVQVHDWAAAGKELAR